MKKDSFCVGELPPFPVARFISAQTFRVQVSLSFIFTVSVCRIYRLTTDARGRISHIMSESSCCPYSAFADAAGLSKFAARKNCYVEWKVKQLWQMAGPGRWRFFDSS